MILVVPAVFVAVTAPTVLGRLGGLVRLLLPLAVVGGGYGLLCGHRFVLPSVAGLGGLCIVVKGGEDLRGGENIPRADAELAGTSAALEFQGFVLFGGAGLSPTPLFVSIVFTHCCLLPLFLSVLPYVKYTSQARREVHAGAEDHPQPSHDVRGTVSQGETLCNVTLSTQG